MFEIILVPRLPEDFAITPAPFNTNKFNGNGMFITTDLPETDPTESDENAAARIALKYDAMERYTKRIVGGKLPSLIISGPPGMSKSWTMEQALKESSRRKHDGVTPIVSEIIQTDEDGNEMYNEDETPVYKEGDASQYYDRISGTCSAPGLYHSLWNMRNGGLVILDDCDSVFENLDIINMLKIATDSSDKRVLSWRKKSSWLADHQIPNSFEFKGHLVFLTNIDFEKEIQKKNKAQEHFKALIDRACYLCLTLRTQRDFMIRIRNICSGSTGMLQRIHGFTANQEQVCLNFIEAHKMFFYNLSIRLVDQVANEMTGNPENWQRDIRATKMRSIHAA
jgi:hypothetical protein